MRKRLKHGAASLPEELRIETKMITHTQSKIAKVGIQTVSTLFHVPMENIKGPGRTTVVVDAKSIAAWVCHKMAGLNLSETAVLFDGHPDDMRSTIGYRVKFTIRMAEAYPEFKRLVVLAGKAVLAAYKHDRIGYENVKPIEREMLDLIYQQAQSPGSAQTPPSPA